MIAIYNGSNISANDSFDSKVFGIIEQTFDEAVEKEQPEIISAAGDLFEMLHEIYGILKFYPELHKPFTEIAQTISFVTSEE
jgi:hypothetical protein